MEAKVTREPAETIRADAIILPLLEGERLPRPAAALDKALGGAIQDLVTKGQFRGRFGQREVLHNLGRLPARQTLLLGLGKRQELDLFRLRNAFQEGARLLKHQRNQVLATWVRAGLGSATPERVAEALVEAATLANFEMGEFKTRFEEPPGELKAIHLIAPNGARRLAPALSNGLVMGEAYNLVRSWANHPANAFTPSIFVERAREVARAAGLEIKVLERRELEREGMGSFLGVARGSEEPPKLISLRYRPRRRTGKSKKVLALVGKGITFDSGGISLKPSDHMEMMKHDMAGGAAVLGAMHAIGRLKPAVEVLAVIPATENLPSGKALKPGDVVRASNGKTIEIINTDAEGRLVLADGLAWALKQGATHLVDIATLTGAVVVALGHVTGGLMGNDRAFVQLAQRAAERAGERFWPLPMFPEYDALLHSDIADLKNSGSRWGGAIHAAVFLREFVGARPWVHLDIAGTAWNDEGDLRQIPKGPTGSGVGLMVHLARMLAR